MAAVVLFPADYFNPRQVEPDYSGEHQAVCEIEGLEPCVFSFDDFVAGGPLRLTGAVRQGDCLYRGWMMQPACYARLYQELLTKGLRLINSPEEYALCHLFPHIYPQIQHSTPRAVWFARDEAVDWERVNNSFHRFMVKDYVKSEKNTDFPPFFETPVDPAAMNNILERFRELRGDAFTGGFLFKEYIQLKRYDEATNEYRAFYLHGKKLCVNQNSHQPPNVPAVPEDFVRSFQGLGSSFYTVDFAQRDDGSWTVIETGDGQVSGLPPQLAPKDFYSRIETKPKRFCLPAY